MYVCMYVCMCVCMYVCMYICVYVHYVCIQCAYICTCTVITNNDVDAEVCYVSRSRRCNQFINDLQGILCEGEPNRGSHLICPLSQLKKLLIVLRKTVWLCGCMYMR